MTSVAASGFLFPASWKVDVWIKADQAHQRTSWQRHSSSTFGWTALMFVSANLQNKSVRQHSNNFTTVISLSTAPVWTRPAAARETSRETLTRMRPRRPAHLERTKYFPPCLQRRHRCCWESPTSDGTPAPGNRSPDGRPWSAKRSPT